MRWRILGAAALPLVKDRNGEWVSVASLVRVNGAQSPVDADSRFLLSATAGPARAEIVGGKEHGRDEQGAEEQNPLADAVKVPISVTGPGEQPDKASPPQQEHPDALRDFGNGVTGK
jgi:hypothetical protein